MVLLAAKGRGEVNIILIEYIYIRGNILKLIKSSYIFSSAISLLPSIALLKSDSPSSLGLNLLSNKTLKSVVILFLSSSLIIIPSATSFIVYSRPLSLLLTLIISIVLLLIIARFSAVPSGTWR